MDNRPSAAFTCFHCIVAGVVCYWLEGKISGLAGDILKGGGCCMSVYGGVGLVLLILRSLLTLELEGSLAETANRPVQQPECREGQKSGPETGVS